MICAIDCCDHVSVARGFCHKHYKRWQVHGDPIKTLLPRDRICKIDGCLKPHSSIGYCAMHERRWRRYGRDHNVLNRFDSMQSAYDSQVIKGDGCWGWTGSTNGPGYGVVISCGKMEFIHRYSYIIHYGDLSDGDQVCHHCDNPICSNPDHLFKGTQKDNVRDCIRKGRFKKVPNEEKARGERVSSSKLKIHEVIDIKRKIQLGMKNPELAKIYNVTDKNISCIRLEKTWKHVVIEESSKDAD